jgi:hypothetical protein
MQIAAKAGATVLVPLSFEVYNIVLLPPIIPHPTTLSENYKIVTTTLN